MKNDIYLKLLPIERQLESAIKSNYARLSSAEFEEFCNTYKEQYGVELTRNEKNCNICRLKALRKAGADFFAYRDWYKSRWGKRPEEKAESNLACDNKAESDGE